MMSCDAGEANVNGTSALPALACDGVTNVLVDAEDGANTVNLGGLTLLAFPLLTRPPSTWRTRTRTRSPAARPGTLCTPTSSTTCPPGPATTGSKAPGAPTGARATTRCGDLQLGAGWPGDDLIVGGAAVLIDGGSGFDSVVIDFAAFTSQTTVSLAITDASINGVTSTSGIEAYDVTRPTE